MIFMMAYYARAMLMQTRLRGVDGFRLAVSGAERNR